MSYIPNEQIPISELPLGLQRVNVPIDERSFPARVLSYVDPQHRLSYVLSTQGLRGDDSEVLGALQSREVSARLLPGETNEYSSEERDFALDALHQSQYSLRNPHAPHLAKEQVVVVDATKPLALLDLAIHSGHDDLDMRQLRRAVSHGEHPKELQGLELACAFLARHENGTDEEKERWSAVESRLYSRHDSAGSLVANVMQHGLGGSAITQYSSLIESGYRDEVMKQFVTDPEAARATVNDVWKESTSLAKRFNSDVAHKGAYTELHLVGDVLVPVVAIGSTRWDTDDSSIGYVSEDSGHTLAEIVDQGICYPRSEFGETDNAIFKTKLRGLVKSLGLGWSARRTLVRRCRTQFDESGNPVVVLDENKTTPGRVRMSNDEIARALDSIGISHNYGATTESAEEPTEQIEQLYEDSSHIPVKLHLMEKKVPLVETGGQVDELALITGLKPLEEGGYALEWTYGVAEKHGDLCAEGVHKTQRFVLELGGDFVNVAAFKYTDKRTGLSRIDWHVSSEFPLGESEKEVTALINASAQLFQKTFGKPIKNVVNTYVLDTKTSETREFAGPGLVA